MTSQNASLLRAKEAKNDEFYTLLKDIEDELQHYTDHFKDKVVYCNCDDPEKSNFVVYFMENFHRLGLKRFIATHYVQRTLFDYMDGNVPLTPKYLDYDGNTVIYDHMDSDGDFRSRESVEFLKESDVVVTNPPFSLFREYVTQLVEYDKQYLVVGTIHAISYRVIFPLIKHNKAWLGTTSNTGLWYRLDDSYTEYHHMDNQGNKYSRVSGALWLTNIPHGIIPAKLNLVKKYTPEKYPEFDNYKAISVKNTNEIPYDYDEIIGVPLTYLFKHNPEQFEIIGISKLSGYCDTILKKDADTQNAMLDGVAKFTRLFIKRR